VVGKKLLSCLKKRDLLNSNKANSAELVELGQRYLQDGLLSDCIDLFEKAHHVEGLIQLREKVAAEGDYFLFQRLTKILEDSPFAQDYMALGDNALGLGKLYFARLAYKQADDHEKTAQVEKLLQLPPEEWISAANMLH
jgi:hypothetical protein